MDALHSRFPTGEAVFRRALRREGLRPEDVDARLLYTGVSWSLHVSSTTLGFRRAVQLAPEHLRADTAWGETCESIAEELGRLSRGSRSLSKG
ncbi:MAG: hypothetical protein ABR564_08730 [Candidatus Dormibacteria bacterium]